MGSALLARGALELLWESCYESGEDYVGTSDDIETLVGWSGDRGVLTQALADAGAPEGHGFIEPLLEPGNDPNVSSTQRYRIHDLWHHAPDYVVKRRRRELERRQKSAPLLQLGHSAPNGAEKVINSISQNEVDRTPSPSPAPSHAPAPSPPSVGELTAGFDRFWAEYPKKVAKDAAWRVWLHRAPDAELANRIIAKVREQRASEQWLKEGGRFIPHPRTWLFQGRWQDEDTGDSPTTSMRDPEAERSKAKYSGMRFGK